MIVCNCNALSERDVDAAILDGADDWRLVHAHLGCTPQCGSCECEIREAIDMLSPTRVTTPANRDLALVPAE